MHNRTETETSLIKTFFRETTSWHGRSTTCTRLDDGLGFAVKSSFGVPETQPTAAGGSVQLHHTTSNLQCPAVAGVSPCSVLIWHWFDKLGGSMHKAYTLWHWSIGQPARQSITWAKVTWKRLSGKANTHATTVGIFPNISPACARLMVQVQVDVASFDGLFVGFGSGFG